MSLREESPLLHNNNNGNLQTYNNEMSNDINDIESINIDEEKETEEVGEVIGDDEEGEDCWTKCWGNFFQCLSKNGIINKIKTGFTVIIVNFVIICTMLIISRIFNNKLWKSNIFTSNSPYSLLAANIVMMASYSIENFLYLRICLSIGCLLFAIWALTSIPILLDTAMFNTVMFLFNVRHAVKLWYAQRYIEFEPEYEKIYKQVFKPYLDSRVHFKKLVDISCMRTSPKGEIFKKKGDEVTSLCCLVKGRISVVRKIEYEPVSVSNNPVFHSFLDDADESDIGDFLRNQHFINLCRENQFIEAPQWVMANLRPDGHRFNVSFVVEQDCKYIKWPKESLINLIQHNNKIYNALNGVLGLHTAHALIASRKYAKIQDEISMNNNNNK